MSKYTLAASMVSAGIAILVTEAVTEKRLLEEFDVQLQEELERSVNYLEETGKAEATEEYEEKKVIGSKFDLTKPSLDDLANKNQKTRYDLIVKNEEYLNEAEEPEEAIIPNSDGPSIFSITMDEYLANESGYLQSTLTYCGDNACIDEDNDYVEDWQTLIGHARPPFGENSGEAHIVYLRNESLRQEFEVINDPEIKAADTLADPEGFVTP